MLWLVLGLGVGGIILILIGCEIESKKGFLKALPVGLLGFAIFIFSWFLFGYQFLLPPH